MCGILSWFSLSQKTVPSGFRDGLSWMIHRGPDGEGIHEELGVALGHRRLKIIDLSDTANQPMCDASRRYWIVFNGEIYNYKEIRRPLETKGYRFRTQSDTEVLLYAYIDEGEACLERLNGMFSFVVYDSLKRQLFAARDRLGIKPLYYNWNGDALAISSEIRSLVEGGMVERDLNPLALQQYLVYGCMQSPTTILRSVRSLLPGHFLRLSDKGLETELYWRQPLVSEESKPSVPMEEAARHVRELLEDSLRYRLISDVPLGAFLSGGIDSSAIVALMSNLGVEHIKTFSIGFDVGGSAYNETNYARQIAKRYNTDHTETIVDGEMVKREIPSWVRHMDQPSLDGFNSFFVSKLARERVTVSLSGLGGDEVFTGYTWVRFLHAVRRFRSSSLKCPESAGRVLLKIYESLPPPLRKSKSLRAALGIAGSWPRAVDAYSLFRAGCTNRELTAMLAGDVLEPFRFHEDLYGEEAEGISSLDAGCLLDQHLYMRNQLLRDVDVVSMAHSLEVRVPFLDHRLVEYVLGLPQSLRFEKSKPKSLLIRAVQDLLPQDLMNRPKMGFSFPFGIWTHGPLKETALDCLSENGLMSRDFFSNRFLKDTMQRWQKEDPYKRTSTTATRVWRLMVLELYLRESFG